MIRPSELAVLSLSDGSTSTITDVNGEIFSRLELPRVEERWVEATDGKRIHCWVIYPPDFDAGEKWPLLTYCQGGPQGQIGQWFSYRWNFHLMAANGYVIVAPNRRGLPGFGREWNDQISGDWGGQAMQDLLSATDSMLGEAYIDNERTAAIGASFGGYSVYWLMGNHEKRFKTMIAHCGVFNLESMYGATEELFFVNWDLGGPYWKGDDVKKDYDRFSPHRFVGEWDTPLLVIHGEKDFRVPVTQGMEAFTAAQVKGVPSRFLYYPNEGHWVQQPQNGVLWHRVFFDWLGRACMSDG
jgi:dipeptidyl aminopeptidase/acylaminoacyl peptidase